MFKKLKKIRDILGVSQTKISELMGRKTSGDYSRAEKGLQPLSKKMMLFYKAIDIDMEWLKRDDDDLKIKYIGKYKNLFDWKNNVCKKMGIENISAKSPKSHKIKMIRLYFGWNRKEFAKQLGITIRTSNSYEQKKVEISPNTLEKLEKLGIDMNWFLNDDDQRLEPVFANLEDNNSVSKIKKSYSNIKLLHLPIIPVDCGFPITTVDIHSYGYFETSTSTSIKDMMAFVANGDSMYPTIMDGDILIAHRRAKAFEGSIIICEIGNTKTCKRIKKTNGVTILHSDNPVYNDIVVESDEWKLVAVVKKIERKI